MDQFPSQIITQVGIIVRDIEKMAEHYASLFGVAKPKIVLTDTVDVAHTEYKGNPTEARAKLAFFKMGQVDIELIEPVGGPSTWMDFLQQHGEGVHHIAYQVDGMKETLAFLDGKGISLTQRGDYTGGRYAYVESEKLLGVALELLEND